MDQLNASAQQIIGQIKYIESMIDYMTLQDDNDNDNDNDTGLGN